MRAWINGCDYLCMLGLKLIHVSKRGNRLVCPSSLILPELNTNGFHTTNLTRFYTWRQRKRPTGDTS